MNIYHMNTYRKDLSWLHFEDEPKDSREVASEGPTVLHIHFCCLSNNSKYLLGAPDQPQQQYSLHSHIIDLKRYRKTSGERNFTERVKVPIFLEAVLAIEIIYIHQPNLEENVNPSILKDDFS